MCHPQKKDHFTAIISLFATVSGLSFYDKSGTFSAITGEGRKI